MVNYNSKSMVGNGEEAVEAIFTEMPPKKESTVFDSITENLKKEQHTVNQAKLAEDAKQDVAGFLKNLKEKGTPRKALLDIEKDLHEHLADGIKSLDAKDPNAFEEFRKAFQENLKKVSEEVGVANPKGWKKVTAWAGKLTSEPVSTLSNGVASTVEGTGKVAGSLGKIVLSPITVSANAAAKVMGRHKVGTAAVAAGIAAATYLATREDNVSEMAEKGVNQLDAAGQQNAAVLNTMIAAQQLSPSTRIAANDAQHHGGQAFGQVPAMGAGRG